MLAYATESEALARLFAFTQAYKLKPHGQHHEIYLSDPRKVAPERIQTILRHPVHAWILEQAGFEPRKRSRS